MGVVYVLLCDRELSSSAAEDLSSTKQLEDYTGPAAQSSTGLCLSRLAVLWITGSSMHSGFPEWLNIGTFLLRDDAGNVI